METIIEAFISELGDGFFRHLIFHYAIVFTLILIPPALVALDTYFATSTARMLGEKIRSRKLRKGIEKLTFYWGGADRCIACGNHRTSVHMVQPALSHDTCDACRGVDGGEILP